MKKKIDILKILDQEGPLKKQPSATTEFREESGFQIRPGRIKRKSSIPDSLSPPRNEAVQKTRDVAIPGTGCIGT